VSSMCRIWSPAIPKTVSTPSARRARIKRSLPVVLAIIFKISQCLGPVFKQLLGI
jgi:hypothetical protein